MKKTKPEKAAVPISLSAKKSGALKHQMLFTPYKIEWKNVPSQAVSQTSSRTFFNSMKSQLSSLKNDVEKLIKKQNSKVENKSMRVIVLDDNHENAHNKSGVSQKTQGSANKLQNSRQLQPDVETGKFQEKMLNEVVNQETINNFHIAQQNIYYKADFDRLAKQLAQRQIQIENLLKQNRLQKNLISELKKQNHQLYTQSQNKVQIMRNLEMFQKQDQNKHKQINSLIAKNAQMESKILNYQKNYQKIKQKNCQLMQSTQSLKNSYEAQNNQIKKANQQLKLHNIYLQQKIESLSQKMTLVTGKFKQKQFYIREMEAKLEALRISKKQYQMHQGIDKVKITEQCRKQFEQKQKQIIEQNNKKFQIMQTMLKQKVKQLQTANEKLSQKFRQQTLTLIYKCKELEQCISQQQNGKQIKTQIVDFKHLGSQFERKINEYVQQNYSLKNKIFSLQSEIQKLEVQKGVLMDEIKIYQQIKQEDKNIENMQAKWDKTIEQIQTLKKQKEDLIEEYQFRIMKLQNQLQNTRQIKSKTGEFNQGSQNVINFNKMLKDQLKQNQQLKEKLRQQFAKTNSCQQTLKQQEQKYAVLSQQLAVSKMKSDLLQKSLNSKPSQSQTSENQESINKLKYELDLLKKKFESLNSMLDNKNKQIKSKDQFIQKVLISKAGKKQEQDEIAYVLNQIKFFSCNNEN